MLPGHVALRLGLGLSHMRKDQKGPVAKSRTLPSYFEVCLDPRLVPPGKPIPCSTLLRATSGKQIFLGQSEFVNHVGVFK